jgi:hypothetical protein
MRWRRSLTILAMLAALMTAPSAAFAAPPNELHAALVDPVAGTTTTPFRLAVSYRSGAGNAASAVTATIGGNQVSLTLTAGTPVSGVWSAVTRLPAGTWTVTYRAVTGKGPQPSASVGPVTVTSPTSPSPSAPGTTTPSHDAAEPGGTPGTSEPAPAATAQPTIGEGRPRETARPAASAATSSPAPAPGATGPRGDGHAGRGSQRPNASASRAAAPVRSADPGPATEGTQPGRPAGELLGAVLLAGLIVVTAVALLGVGWILTGARRERATPTTADGATVASDPAVSAIPTIEARARRRARLRTSDDPILASLGLPEPAGSTEPNLEGRLPRGEQQTKR